MNEYTIQELAENLATYYRQEPSPDYTAEGLEAALEWAWNDDDETVAGWSVDDVLDRALGAFNLALTPRQARTILNDVAKTDVDWSAVDYCIKQWKDKKR